MNEKYRLCCSPPGLWDECNAWKSCRGCLGFDYPRSGARLNRLAFVAGYARAYDSVTVYMDEQAIVQVRADACGHWQAEVSVMPEDGVHTLCAMSQWEDACVGFFVEGGGEAPLPPAPVITEPTGQIMEASPVIRGTAEPGITVRICMDGGDCHNVTAAADGSFSLQYPGVLEEGRHLVTAEAVSAQGVRSEVDFQFFLYEAPEEFSVVLFEAEEGGRFRTVGLDLSVASPVYPVTVFYLLLPPGSAEPTAAEIENYTGPGLDDGTAAQGHVTLERGGRQFINISGQDNAPAGALGVVDGYRYDVYIFARAGENQTPVMADRNVTAMAFDGGHGTEGDPYLIRQLSDAELLKYPDLSASRSPLGVDDTARLLRNIANLKALSLSTGGRYGLYSSMSMAYQLTSPMDLRRYAAADGGTGWPAIGDQGNNRDFLSFSGSLKGGGGDTPIRNLTVISDRAKRYVGLFASSTDAQFQDLALENGTVRIADSFAEDFWEMNIGLLCAEMRNGLVERISLTDASITRTGDSLASAIGGLVGEGRGSILARELLGERIRIESSYGDVSCLFGKLGEYSSRGVSAENIVIRDSVVSGLASPSGLFGGQIYGPELLRDITASNCSMSGEALMGMIGQCKTTLNHCLAERLHCERLKITGNRDGYFIGGMFGHLMALNGMLLKDSEVIECEIRDCRRALGGFVGHLQADGEMRIERCHVRAAVLGGTEEECGGFVGSLRLARELPEQSRILTECSAEISGTMICQSYGGGFAGRCYTGDELDYKVEFNACTCKGKIQCMDNRCGGFIGYCEMGIYNQCRADCETAASVLVGGFVGDCTLREDSYLSPVRYQIPFTQCSAVGLVRQNGEEAPYGYAGGFAGRANVARITESFSTAAVFASAPDCGALIGYAGDDTVVEDCYAAGDLESSNEGVGGIFGSTAGEDTPEPGAPNVTVRRCYYRGSVIRAGADTGGIGGRCEGEGVTIQGSLVLSPSISGKAPVRRVAGNINGAVTLEGNYATTAQVLEDGAPRVIESNPNGQDGGTIAPEDITQRMTAAGWSSVIWNYETAVEGRGPQLRSNPESIETERVERI